MTDENRDMGRPGAQPLARVNYDDLELDDELALLDGKPFTGIVYAERPDGSLESEGNYVEGLPDGLQESWYAGGQIAGRFWAVRGNGASEVRTWYRNGQARSVERFADLRLVEAQAWDEAGRAIDRATLGDNNAFGQATPGRALD